MKTSDMYVLVASMYAATYKPDVFNLVIAGVFFVTSYLYYRKGQ